LEHRVSILGRYVAERSITAFHRSGKFTVIERDLLERTLKKLNLTVPDLADPANVQLLGRALNIQAMAKGTIGDLGDSVELNVRLVRAAENAGQVIAVAQVAVKKDAQIAKLLGQILAPTAGTTGAGPAASGATGAGLSVDLGQGVTLDMVAIPAGEFDMGSSVLEPGRGDDEHMHRVRIAQAFYIGKFEVTQAQWMLVMGANPSSKTRDMRGPVTDVSWEECQKFLARLNDIAGDKLPQGHRFRLPTEAEWEYACRAGTTTKYSFGDDVEKLGMYAWFGDSNGSIHAVGTKRANPWGIHDMHGNVWEWCQDWFGPYETVGKGAVEDPSGQSSGSYRVLRGGGWYYGAGDCRSARRNGDAPSSRRGNFGLRVVAAP
jgi:formylglycine-generating enzyme required for sulfatase activity